MLDPGLSMARYVAFLRAINVGGRVVKMQELRRIFEAWGAAHVDTFIASGNVVFDTPRRNLQAAERSLEHKIRAALGYPVVTFLRSLPEVAAVAAHAPFPPAESGAAGATLFVGFMKHEPDRSVATAVAALSDDLNAFAVYGRELYWLRRRRLIEAMRSGGPPLERIVGSPVTTRNVNTVRRMAAKYCAELKRRHDP
jgi:uncharacterized protein (DUF1697 family)